MFQDFIATLRFLTILPTPSGKAHQAGFSRMGFWFPLVGGLIGLILLVLDGGLRFLFPSEICAALVLLAWVMLTGGLHLDGVGDCCDAFFAAVPPERRLEIIKDVHKGSFGVAGVALVLLLKFAGLAAMPALAPRGSALELRWGLIFAPMLARWLVLIAALQPRARPDGLGAALARDLNPATVVLAGMAPLALAVWIGYPAAAGTAASLVLLFGVCAWARRKIGGLTGDVLGLTIETSEALLLIVFSLLLWR